MIGCDEVGKGDLFGPLIVCGVVENKELKKLPNVKDSKKLSNLAISIVAAEIKKICQYEIEIIQPFYYNILYEKYNNQILLLKEVYIDLIQRMSVTYKADNFLIDKFYNGSIHDISIPNLNIQMQHRAETDFVSVAAASILARNELLGWFANHPKLHMGSTKDASRCLKHVPQEQRDYFVKLHFRV